MNRIETELAGAYILEPKVFEDSRGFFLEIYHQQRYRENGIELEFVQDNHSRSSGNVLRGLHFQIEQPQGKLIRAIRGEIFDVAVDLRFDSATFGRSTAVRLSESNRRQFYVPPGMAHGFCVLSDVAEVVYKCTDYYHPESERTILWDDPELAIDWPIGEPILSRKDQAGLSFAEATEAISVSR